ncbi:glycerophosphodiester phosphodiesterase family protein [Parerythrobacter aestuarii]|uniref:glycerophosphodiester phosphodiesterase family protein n=1 Tax=Parerythrobacter aestuarii TaxID=3020909 RepID=UPI0024DEBDE6|nr:glycerophosphodiester phosphodiesterase family protein [Parerythrobacter aestuarii]
MATRPVPDWLTQWEYAHRGLHGPSVPENSLAGTKLAVEAGMGIECDIQRSADDWPMVFHDWDLLRLTGKDGLTEGATGVELKQLRYLDSDESPATLGELLALVAGRVPLLIEIKSKRGYDVEQTCREVSRCLEGYSGKHAVMSFDPRVARWFRRHSPQTVAGLVMREDEHGYTQKRWQRRLAFAIAKPDFLAYHIAALPNAWIAGLRAKGLPVLTWTVNSPETRARALLHADSLIAEGEGLA